MNNLHDSLKVYSWFVESPLRPGLELWPLVLGLALLAVVLGYIFFTDLHGYVIPNHITIPLAFLALIVSPFLYTPPWKVLAFGGGVTIFFALLTLTGKFGAGDFKLLAGLSFLFGKAIIGIFFIASFIALLYAIPMMLSVTKSRRNGEEVGKLGKLKNPLGPAIALACVVPVAVSAHNHLWALLFLAGIGVAFAASEIILNKKKTRLAINKMIK